MLDWIVEAIKFWNEYALVLQAVLLFVLVLLTAAYVRYTRGLVSSQEKTLRELRFQHEASSRAYVVARIAVSQRALFLLEIVNEGKSAATNLRLELDRDLYQYGKKELHMNSYPIFSRETKVFPPGTRFVVALWTDFQCLGEKPEPLCPKEFTVKTEYESLGKSYQEDWYIDLDFYGKQKRPPLSLAEAADRISDEFPKIRRDLENLNRKLQDLVKDRQ